MVRKNMKMTFHRRLACRFAVLIVSLSLISCATREPLAARSLPAPYHTEAVSIAAPEGHVLAGTLTVPQDPTSLAPAVVLIHGSGKTDRDQTLSDEYRPFSQLADALSRKRIAVLRYDKRGVAESTGDFANATTADFADDVRTIVAYLRTRHGFDPSRVALLGHSEGGLIAPMVAATDPQVAAVVLLATSSRPGRSVLEYQARKHAERNPAIPAAEKESAAANLLAGFVSRADGPWLRYLLDYDPVPAASQIDAPVLILHGANDPQVPSEQATELAAVIRTGGNSKVRVRVLQNFGHLFVDDPMDEPVSGMAAEVIDTIVDWLLQTLSAPARESAVR